VFIRCTTFSYIIFEAASPQDGVQPKWHAGIPVADGQAGIYNVALNLDTVWLCLENTY
jgi:hypothetical protein